MNLNYFLSLLFLAISQLAYSYDFSFLSEEKKQDLIYQDFRFYYYSIPNPNISLNNSEENISSVVIDIPVSEAFTLSEKLLSFSNPIIYKALKRNNQIESVFTKHELGLSNKSFESETISSTSWGRSLTFLLIILLLVLSKLFNGIKFKSYLFNWINNKDLNNISTEDKVFFEPVSLLLFLASFLTLSYSVYYIIEYYNYQKLFEFYVLDSYFKVLLALSIVFFGYYLIVNVLAFAFEEYQLLFNFRYYTIQTFYVLGMILFPMILLIEYSSISASNLIYISYVVFILFFVIRFLKLFININYKGVFSKLYIIFYLCTLEILPIFIIIKQLS
jgi:hypothetical protein